MGYSKLAFFNYLGPLKEVVDLPDVGETGVLGMDVEGVCLLGGVFLLVCWGVVSLLGGVVISVVLKDGGVTSGGKYVGA